MLFTLGKDKRITTKMMNELIRYVESSHFSYFFDIYTISAFFEIDKRFLCRKLKRHIENKTILQWGRGIYSSSSVLAMPSHAYTLLIPFLRPYCLNYVSLEYCLSEWGVISQIPNVFTVMTSGRGGHFRGKYSNIELTSFSRKSDKFLEELSWNEEKQILEASPVRAYKDLKRVGRNVNLVDLEELEEAQEEWEKTALTWSKLYGKN